MSSMAVVDGIGGGGSILFSRFVCYTGVSLRGLHCILYIELCVHVRSELFSTNCFRYLIQSLCKFDAKCMVL